MDDLRATRDSWDIDDMPTDQVALNLDLAFAKKEMAVAGTTAKNNKQRCKPYRKSEPMSTKILRNQKM